MVVLVVDDEPLVREIVAEGLLDDGLQVVEAPTAEVALCLALPEAQPAAAVIDIHLGQGMDGLGLAVEIRRKWPDAGVVLMTGQPSRLRQRGFGADEPLLVKPFDPSALVRAVRQVMRS